jgi:SAM-dependent methyltransferase
MEATTSALGCGCQLPHGGARTGWTHQFEKPTGLLGRLVGHLMAMKNRARSRWVIALLQVRPADRILEIGFGPGADICRVARLARDGFVAGVDHSELMVRHARRRNRRAVRAGRVEVQLGQAISLPYPAAAFDKVFSINCAQFWGDPRPALREQLRVLRPGGVLAVTVQPRWRGADERSAQDTGRALAAALEEAGLTQVRTERKALRPVSAVCVLGVK